jgi:hypothetical protein
VQGLQAPGLQGVHVQHCLLQQHASKAKHCQAPVPILSQGDPGQAAKGIGKPLFAGITPATAATAAVVSVTATFCRASAT